MQTRESLAGRCVLVTGGAKRLGAAMARRLHGAGASIVIHCHRSRGALFPHLNVNENIAFGLKMRRMGQTEIRERVATLLQLVNLENFGERKITDLSGGQQQRVALARALAMRPRLLMFDEPLGALDRTLREDLLFEVRTLLRRTKIPALYVTQDQEEACGISDRILIVQDCRIVRDGTPKGV